MTPLPFYIPLVFVLTTVLTVYMLYKASRSMTVLATVVLWLALQAVLALSGFYTVTSGVPPRFILLVLPPMLVILVMFLSKKGKTMIDGMDVKTLTLLHIVRVPVELTLYWLFVYKAVPEIMTFEGRNFDILCGLTAPLIWYFGYVKKTLGRNVLIAWNIVCVLLLANIVLTAVLSAPFSFQQWGFEQPNIAVLYFPYVWLPCCIVPVVLWAHLVAIRRLAYAKA